MPARRRSPPEPSQRLGAHRLLPCAQPAQALGGCAPAAQDAEEEVLGGDELVPQLTALVVREDDRLARLVPEPLEHAEGRYARKGAAA